MRLWIDDVRKMPNGFDLWARNYNEAIKHLSSNLITFVSFDHDLGLDNGGVIGKKPTTNEMADAKTGYDVAKWIEQKAHDGEIPKLEWNVHSSSPSGSANIVSAMQSAERFWNKK